MKTVIFRYPGGEEVEVAEEDLEIARLYQEKSSSKSRLFFFLLSQGMGSDRENNGPEYVQAIVDSLWEGY